MLGLIQADYAEGPALAGSVYLDVLRPNTENALQVEQVEYRYMKCLKGSDLLCQFLTCKLFAKLVTEVVPGIARLLYRYSYA